MFLGEAEEIGKLQHIKQARARNNVTNPANVLLIACLWG